MTRKQTSRKLRQIQEALRHKFQGATVFSKGICVMKNGRLRGKPGKTWWDQKIRQHKKWLRKNKKTPLPTEHLFQAESISADYLPQDILQKAIDQ